MPSVAIQMPEPVWHELLRHLLPTDSELEQGAFLLAQFESRPGGGGVFTHLETQLLRQQDYTSQESDYLELTDSTRARLIKSAHDRQASLVEFHSHPSNYPACLSPSDISGLREFVPHVRWRLAGRPYAAIVVAPKGFDGLAWTSTAGTVEPVAEMHIGEKRLRGTGLTMQYWKGRIDEQV